MLSKERMPRRAMAFRGRLCDGGDSVRFHRRCNTRSFRARSVTYIRQPTNASSNRAGLPSPRSWWITSWKFCTMFQLSREVNVSTWNCRSLSGACPLRWLSASSGCYRPFLLAVTPKFPSSAFSIPVRSERANVTQSSRTLSFSCWDHKSFGNRKTAGGNKTQKQQCSNFRR